MRGTGRAGVEYALCLRTVRGLSADSLSDSLWTFFLTDEMSSLLRFLRNLGHAFLKHFSKTLQKQILIAIFDAEIHDRTYASRPKLRNRLCTFVDYLI